MKIRLEGEQVLTVSEIDSPGMELETAPHVHAHFSSFEMFTTSVALCTASVLAGYGEQLHVGTAGLAVRVQWSLADKPRRIGELVLDFAWPELPASRRRAASHCPLHKTLEHSPRLVTRVHPGEEAARLIARSEEEAGANGHPHDPHHGHHHHHH